MAQSAKLSVSRLVILQAIIVLTVMLAWTLNGDVAAVSALLGGTACVLPNLYFARRFFAASREKEPRRILRAFYLGELTKLLLAALLVVVAFKVWQVQIIPFITGYLGAHLGLWFAPLLTTNNARARTR